MNIYCCFSVVMSCLESCEEWRIFPFFPKQLSVTDYSFVPVICVGGQLGSICTEGFDNADAEVVCRILAASLNLTSRGEYWLF